MKKTLKIPLIILSVLFSIILLLAIAVGGIYFYSEMVRFDHIDCQIAAGSMYYEVQEDYSINYPFFGNSLALSGGNGRSYALIFGSGGKKNIQAYNAVNNPIVMWIDYLAVRYKLRVNIDYTMEQDDKTITVALTGSATDDEEKNIPISQKFIFNIENASPENLPEWTNEDELDGDCEEYWEYIINPNEVPCPDWLAQRNGI